MNKLQRQFSAEAASTGIFKDARSKSLPIKKVGRGQIVMFKDPARPGFPDVDAEVGMVYEKLFVSNPDAPAVLAIMPLSVLKDDADRIYGGGTTILNEHYTKSKMDMSINPNMNFVLGQFIGSEQAILLGSKNEPMPLEHRMRYIVPHETTLGLGDGGNVITLKKCEGVLWGQIRRSMSAALEEDSIRDQFTKGYARAYFDKHLLGRNGTDDTLDNTVENVTALDGPALKTA